MCNLYLMYYTPVDNNDFKVCSGQDSEMITNMLPVDSDAPLSAIMKEQPISYDNGRPDLPASNKDKKQYSLFRGKETLQ